MTTQSVPLHELPPEAMLTTFGGMEFWQRLDDHWLYMAVAEAIVHAFATAPASNYMYGKVGYT